MSILKEIILHKEKELSEAKRRIPLNQLRKGSRPFPILDFQRSLAQPGIQIIAEIKRKSPSSGNIKPNVDPATIAREYSQNGAAAISVLTDENYFGGNLEHLRRIKRAVNIPVLRKEFIFSEYQVWESYLAGADAILLIVDILQLEVLENLYHIATDLKLAVLMELYSTEKLGVVKKLDPRIVGVNARDLQTMKTDLKHCAEVFPLLPPSALKVAESGIHTSENLRFIKESGYDAALIGTSLMKSPSPGSALRHILQGVAP